MKNYLFAFVLIPMVHFLAVLPENFHSKEVPQINTLKDTVIYKDGTYTGKSQASYTEESYWGKAVIKISKGKLVKVNFTITDTARNVPFNEAYKKYFKGNEEYVQQTINDAKGMKEYPGKLLKSQDIGKVDAISGATWSYNIFKASVGEALKKAVK